jgi:hypothetical protein
VSVQGADLAGHGAVEAADPGDAFHSLTIVRDRWLDKGTISG